ncbi:MAG TPA: DUF2332 domain-containing protein [Trebonia sp.]|nr:DUF2332 domain-containing protein [Trebonia sp.]
MPSTDEVRGQALEVARGWSPPGAPPSWRLTAALFEAIAADDDLLGRLAALPGDRLPALLGSAAIAYLIRRDQPYPLAAYFPEPGGPQPPFDKAFFPAFRAFCAERIDDIAALCQERRYQMNEVARCAQLALGIAAVSAGSGDPVALVDLGTGAGLTLQLDRYRYRTGGGTYGPPGAGLTLDCEVRGPVAPPPAGLPPVATRVGIDIAPVDLADAESRAWLTACAPPEASALARLDAAVRIARAHPATIIAGDIVDTLPRVLAGLPARQRVLVTDAYTAVFLPDQRRDELARILADAGRRRPVTWLSLDPLVPLGPLGHNSVQGLPLPTDLVGRYQRDGVFAVLGARTFGQAGDGGRLLACAHPSGQWTEWLEPAG